jgi:hypothetical protein
VCQLVWPRVYASERGLLSGEADQEPSVFLEQVPEKGFWPDDWLFNGLQILPSPGALSWWLRSLGLLPANIAAILDHYVRQNQPINSLLHHIAPYWGTVVC